MIDLSQFLTAEEQRNIAAAFDRNGFGNITAVFESLDGKWNTASYDLSRGHEWKRVAT